MTSKSQDQEPLQHPIEIKTDSTVPVQILTFFSALLQQRHWLSNFLRLLAVCQFSVE